MTRDPGPRAVAVLTAGLLLTGCANAATPALAADGRPALEGSLAGLRAGNYTFTRSGGSAAQGSVQLPDSLITPAYGPAARRTGNAFYLRYRIHGEAHDEYAELLGQAESATAEVRTAQRVMSQLDGAKWVRADEKRLVEAAGAEDQSGLEYLPVAPTPERADVTGATALIDAVGPAQLSGTTVTGTLDATRIDPELTVLTDDAYYVYGPRANAMPFRAELDDQGRLTRFTVDLPGALQAPASRAPADMPSDSPTEAPAEPLVITISEYGTTTVAPAPKDAPELDPEAYERLTNDID